MLAPAVFFVVVFFLFVNTWGACVFGTTAAFDRPACVDSLVNHWQEKLSVTSVSEDAVTHTHTHTSTRYLIKSKREEEINGHNFHVNVGRVC